MRKLEDKLDWAFEEMKAETRKTDEADKENENLLEVIVIVVVVVVLVVVVAIALTF